MFGRIEKSMNKNNQNEHKFNETSCLKFQSLIWLRLTTYETPEARLVNSKTAVETI